MDFPGARLGGILVVAVIAAPKITLFEGTPFFLSPNLNWQPLFDLERVDSGHRAFVLLCLT